MRGDHPRLHLPSDIPAGPVGIELLVAVLALVSVGIGIYEVVTPRREPGVLSTLDVVDLAIVAFFIAEFIWSARRASSASVYLRHHWYELPALIPVTTGMIAYGEAFPLLRVLRLVRLVRLLRLVRTVGAYRRLRLAMRRTERIAARARLALVFLGAVLVAFVGALLLFVAEVDHNPRVHTFWDAIWWAFALITTVGPSDLSPVTGWGRAFAVFLMASSVTFVGVFTAFLASTLVESPWVRGGRIVRRGKRRRPLRVSDRRWRWASGRRGPPP